MSASLRVLLASVGIPLALAGLGAAVLPAAAGWILLGAVLAAAIAAVSFAIQHGVVGSDMRLAVFGVLIAMALRLTGALVAAFLLLASIGAVAQPAVLSLGLSLALAIGIDAALLSRATARGELGHV